MRKEMQTQSNQKQHPPTEPLGVALRSVLNLPFIWAIGLLLLLFYLLGVQG